VSATAAMIASMTRNARAHSMVLQLTPGMLRAAAGALKYLRASGIQAGAHPVLYKEASALDLTGASEEALTVGLQYLEGVLHGRVERGVAQGTAAYSSYYPAQQLAEGIRRKTGRALPHSERPGGYMGDTLNPQEAREIVVTSARGSL
jgi:hypothetical protein